MIKIYGFFKDGDFNLNKVVEVKEEDLYLDMKLRKRIEEGENIYFRYFNNNKELDKWLSSYTFINNL